MIKNLSLIASIFCAALTTSSHAKIRKVVEGDTVRYEDSKTGNWASCTNNVSHVSGAHIGKVGVRYESNVFNLNKCPEAIFKLLEDAHLKKKSSIGQL